MTLASEIAIQAQIISDDVCQLTADRPILNGSAYFDNKEAAEESPLAKKLFEIQNIDSVLISENNVKVTKLGFQPWMTVAKLIGSAIREQLQSGEPAVSDSYFSKLPPEDVIRKKIEHLIKVEINPSVESHGGFVNLVNVKRNDVFLQLGGGCQGCGMANVTLRAGIERTIRTQIPEVGAIIDITDHANGTNPYYRAN